ncbi:MAG TPA: peptidylprolyl isomerase [Acidimicrobiales bacterium]|nr:peptidylprolyl isomerase [Acidimicrobiales bacterium]
MGTEKRERQKEGRQQRLAAEQANQRRNQRRRRLVAAVLVSLVVFGALVLIAQTGGDDEADMAADDTTSTTAAESTDSTVPAAPVAFEYGAGDCPPPEKPPEPVLEFEQAPPLCIDPAQDYTAVFTTSAGQIRVDLDTETTPGTVNNFVFLARHGYYDGTLIHRSDPSIDILQGGSPHTQSASDPGPGYTIPDEGTTDRTYEAGDLVMARTAAPNSAGAQFFFVAGPAASALDSQGTYVTFGEVTEGLDVVQQILATHKADPNSQLGGAPDPPVTIESVEIIER